MKRSGLQNSFVLQRFDSAVPLPSLSFSLSLLSSYPKSYAIVRNPSADMAGAGPSLSLPPSSLFPLPFVHTRPTDSLTHPSGFHYHPPSLVHRTLAKSLGASMWFWIFYRARSVPLSLPLSLSHPNHIHAPTPTPTPTHTPIPSQTRTRSTSNIVDSIYMYLSLSIH